MISKENITKWAKGYLNDPNISDRILEGEVDSYYYSIPTPERSDNLMPPSHVGLIVLKETGEVFDVAGDLSTTRDLKGATNAKEYKELVNRKQEPIAIVPPSA